MTATYTFQTLDDAPILLFTANADYHIATDLPHSTKDLLRILDKQPQPVVYVLNLLNVLPSVDEVMVAATTVGRGDKPTYHHPNLKKVIAVTVDELMIAGLKGLENAVFGSLHLHHFRTLEAALEEAYASV